MTRCSVLVLPLDTPGCQINCRKDAVHFLDFKRPVSTTGCGFFAAAQKTL
jgi:hypothetical protein